MPISASVVICLYEPGDFLVHQIQALKAQEVLVDLEWEVIYVDNTPEGKHSRIILESAQGRPLLRYLHEPVAGKCRAANLGIESAQGEIVLFTDDDVLPGPKWLISLVEPILKGETDVVTGRIQLAESLKQPWMSSIHESILINQPQGSLVAGTVIGANVAMKRSAFLATGGYDCELGPGALGGHEDSLLGVHLVRLGCRFANASDDGTVTHWVKPERLTRRGFLSYAKGEARSWAHLQYHWYGARDRWAMIKAVRSTLGLWWVRLAHPLETKRSVMSPAEYYQVRKSNYYWQLSKEQRRSHK